MDTASTATDMHLDIVAGDTDTLVPLGTVDSVSARGISDASIDCATTSPFGDREQVTDVVLGWVSSPVAWLGWRRVVWVVTGLRVGVSRREMLLRRAVMAAVREGVRARATTSGTGGDDGGLG
jgi:hypothetical protein